MQWIEEKYIGSLSMRLSMFKRIESGYNFRCFVCGDSQKSKTKARGFLLHKQGKYGYYCHNCNISLPFATFLEKLDPTAYQDYIREKYTEKANNFNTARITEPAADISRFITPKFIKYTALSNLKKISQLDPLHPARRYVVSRKIPNIYHSKLFFAPKFKEWTNTLRPNKFDLSLPDEPRLVIPFVDKGGNLFGYQGRVFGKKEPRYITIILNEETPRVYGLEAVNTRKRVYIVEGPIDSMFIDNCLAMAGSHLDKTVSEIGIAPSNVTVVYDNEPRNKDIVRSIEKSIDLGYSVCVWPADLKYKDVNEMVNAGMLPQDIQQLIDKCTYKDLLAKMMLTQWKRI